MHESAKMEPEGTASPAPLSGNTGTTHATREDAAGDPTWRPCVEALLAGLSLDAALAAAPTLGAFAASLAGTGFELDRVPTDAGGLPLIDGALACLVQTADGWQLRQPARPGASVEAPTGEVLELWVLRRRPGDLLSLLPFFMRHRAELGGLFIAAIVVNALSLTLPLFSSFVYDKVLGNGIMETLWALVIGLMLVVGIDFAVRVIRTSVAERFGVATEADIDHAVFRNLLRTSANRMPSLGPVLEKYKQVLSYRDMLSSSLLISLADLPFLLLFLAAIALQSGPLVLVSVVCGGLTVLATLMCHVPVLRYDQIARQAGEKRFGLLSDLLGSREAVIGGAFRASLANRWRQASVSAASAASRARYWRSLGGALSSALSYISFVAVIVGGVYMIEDRTLTSGGLLAASMLTSRVMSMFGAAAGLHLRWGELRMAIRELDQTVPQVVETRADRQYGRLKGAVRLEHVNCRLRQGDKPVLEDLSLAVGAGEIVGIAGAPGCGKTTLLRLLAGVIDPDGGRVLLDDLPIRELSDDDITVNIGYKPQEFALFDGTIIDNVLAGRPSPSPESMRGLLLATGLAAPFDAGALNWHTEIGPRGSRLSGGQRQLVALARSFVGGPPLLLLDEPSNGLDAALETHLARQIAALRGRATVFVSTHSRTLLLACDRIIVLGDGRLLANGPRDKVLMPASPPA